MTVGERIKKIRMKLGMSQVDFADKINVSKQTLYKYENNIITNIPSDKIEAAADLGNVSPSYIMGWCEDYGFKNVPQSTMTKSDVVAFKKNYDKSNLRKNTLESKILDNMSKLNNNGKKSLLDYSTILLGNPNFTNNDSDSITARAAHNDFANNEEQQQLMKEDLDEL